MGTHIPTAELCDRFAQLYTGLVTDAMDDMGYQDQTLDAGLSPLEGGMRAAGVAYPAEGRTNRSVDPDEQIRRFLEMLGDAPEDSVLTMNTNDTDSSHIGELSTIALANAGCRGAVVEGGVRDTELILEQAFPVFTQFATPEDSSPRWELLEWGAPAVVGGVRVEPGDIVVADVDGVVVVPEPVAEDVLVAAEEDRENEAALREALRDGADPLEAFEEYQTF